MTDSKTTRTTLLTVTPNNPAPVPTERYVRLLVILATLLLLLLWAYLFVRGLELIHHTILLFALGGLLAYALDPIVEWVRGRPVAIVPNEAESGKADDAKKAHEKSHRHPARQRPRWLGVVAVFATVAVTFGLIVFLIGKQMVYQAQVFAHDKDKIQAQATEKLRQGDAYLQAHNIPFSLADTIQRPPPSVKEWEEKAAHSGLLFASDFSRGAVEGAVVLLVAIYFLLFSEELRGATTRLFPLHIQPYVSEWQDDANRILGGFVRGQAILALTLGISAGIACGALGLRFSLLIGAFVVIASLVPVIGPYIGAVPAVISAALSNHALFSPGVSVILVLILFILINEAGSKVIYPRIVGKALGLHEMVVLFVLLAGLEMGGIIGTLLAAPLTALVLVTIKQGYRLWLALPPGVSARDTEETGVEPPSTNTANQEAQGSQQALETIV